MERALREFRIRGREDQHAVPRGADRAPALPGGRLHHPVHRRDAGAVPLPPAARPRHPAAARSSATSSSTATPRSSAAPSPTHMPVPAIPAVPPRPREPDGHAATACASSAPRASPAGCATQKRLLLTDTTFRDAHQSLLATRFRTHDLLGVGRRYYARHLAGLFSLEMWGGATFDAAMRFLQEDPWDRLAQLREPMPNILLPDAAAGLERGRLHELPRQRGPRLRRRRRPTPGIDLFRVFDASTGSRTCAWRWTPCARRAMLLRGGDLLHRRHPRPGAARSTTSPTTCDLAKELEAAGAHILGIKDMAGLCKPEAAAHAGAGAARGDRHPDPLPHARHGGHRGRVACWPRPRRAWTSPTRAMAPMSGLTSQPNLSAVVEALRGSPARHRPGARAAGPGRRLLGGRARAVRRFESDHARRHRRGLRARDARRPVHEPAPAGAGAGPRGALARGRARLRRGEPDVRRHRQGHARPRRSSATWPSSWSPTTSPPTQVLDPDRELAFPDSVVEFFHGDLGQPHGGFPEDAPGARCSRAPTRCAVRPGEVLPPDRPRRRARAEVEKKVRRQVSDRELASYLMYPKVFPDFAEHQRAVRRRERAADAGLLLRPRAATTSCSSTSSAARR